MTYYPVDGLRHSTRKECPGCGYIRPVEEMQDDTCVRCAPLRAKREILILVADNGLVDVYGKPDDVGLEIYYEEEGENYWDDEGSNYQAEPTEET